MPSIFKSNINNWLLPILSGFFIGTSYIPFPPWAALFCFIPLWRFWHHQSQLKSVLIGGFVTSFIFTLIGFNWVAYLLHEFAHLNWPLSVLGLLFYALLAHLFVPVAGLLWFLGQRKFNWPKPLSVALMAVITVLTETYSLTLFDWNFGYSWYGADLPLYHWAEIIGFKGISTLTLLANLPLYWAFEYRRQRKGQVLALLTLAGFLAMNATGTMIKEHLPKPDARFNTVIVQASIDNAEKLAAELGEGYSREIVSRYLTLTDQAAANYQNRTIDFVMWPETAFPSFLGADFKDNELSSALKRFLNDRHLSLITGAYGADRQSRKITNSLFIVDKKGIIQPSFYSKTVLLAFGEYIPGEDYFPAIRNWLPPTGHFARGFGPTQLLTWNNFKIGAQICYESLFPDFSRRLADLGAQFIVNATNDSWYGTWQEPYQHMYMTLARAVEFRRPVVRATNTGISTVALASGEILQRSPLNSSWAGFFEVSYLKNPPATFYQRWFHLIHFILWSLFIGLFIIGLKVRRLENQANDQCSHRNL